MDAGFQTNIEEETGVHMKVEADFYFIYNFGTGSNLYPGPVFHFIPPLWGCGHLVWVMGVRIGVCGVKTVPLGSLMRVIYSIRTMGSNSQGDDVFIAASTMGCSRDDWRSSAN